MNTLHKDINKIIPFGEFLRGFIIQRYITVSDLSRVLRERGIFVLNHEKDIMVPVIQNLLLSPTEFDKIRYSFSEKEDNEKKFSREIIWSRNAQIFDQEFLTVPLDDFIKKRLPTCKLIRPVIFTKQDNNPNHIIATFEIERHDMNKSWYEQTNIFHGSIEFINDNGKGYVRITHTAAETKDLAEEILRVQVNRYKNKGTIPQTVIPKKILFSEFTNANRFVFFYRLTNQLENDIFSCNNIKDISIKPEENSILPEGISWMNRMKKILISGESLDKTFFMKERAYHSSLILWNIDAVFSFDYKGEKGTVTICLGFPDYNKKAQNAEFEITIHSLNSDNRLSPRDKKKLESHLLSEMDKQKSLVYSNFIGYLKEQKK